MRLDFNYFKINDLIFIIEKKLENINKLISSDINYKDLVFNVETKESLEKLNKSTSFIKGKLGKVIRLKRIPNLTFKLDYSLEAGSNVLSKLKSITNE